MGIPYVPPTAAELRRQDRINALVVHRTAREVLDEMSVEFEAKHPRGESGRFIRKRRLRAVA
jgi:hypothetical protein